MLCKESMKTMTSGRYPRGMIDAQVGSCSVSALSVASTFYIVLFPFVCLQKRPTACAFSLVLMMMIGSFESFSFYLLDHGLAVLPFHFHMVFSTV